MFPQTQKYLVGLNLVQRYSKLLCPSDTHIPQIPVIVLQVSYHYEYNRFFFSKASLFCRDTNYDKTVLPVLFFFQLLPEPDSMFSL